MCTQLRMFVALLWEFSFFFTSVSPQGTGQKAHFSLQDTPGSFTVHANKMLAKVSSKPDSIKVVVKPGMAEFPVPQLPTQKPLVHVASPAIIRPVGGFNFMSVGRKRSRVESGKKSFGKEEEKQKLFKKKVKTTTVHSKISTSIVKSKKIGKNRWMGGKRILWRSVGKVGHDTPGIYKRIRGYPKSRTSKDVDVKSGEKRELIERKMKVHGGTGKFSVHVDKKMTEVSSSTAGVKVFIKNPSPKEMSQLPREMLQLPGVMSQLPNGMSQFYNGMSQLPGPVSQFTKGKSPLPKEKPWTLVRFPTDWTGASDWEDNDN